MKPSHALGCTVLLMMLLLSGSGDCRPIQVKGSTDGEYFVQDGLFNVQDFGSKAKSDFKTQNGDNNVGNSEIMGDASRLRRNVQHAGDFEVYDTSDQEQQHMISADASQPKTKQNPTEGVKIEIIERPKELKVLVNKSPVQRKQSLKNKHEKELKQLQREIVSNAKLKSTDENNSKGSESVEWDAKPSAENEMYSVDDEETSSSGEIGSGDTLDAIRYEEDLLSRDQAQQKLAKQGKTHQEKKVNESRAGLGPGGIGILLTALVIACVFAVVSCVFLSRWCRREAEAAPDAESGSLKMKYSGRRLSKDPSALKEARIKVGKQKSSENRKVLRRLSADQGANTVKEELAIACSVICPDMETRRKNSGALHTRACIRAASQSRRKSSFQEELQAARCEFANAPARLAKLVSSAGDEKETKTTQD